jgi:ketosteroid isomerase-like protein
MMKREELVALVERYFGAVDGEDFETLQTVLTDDCVFSVETHGVELHGISAIDGMFQKLWADHASVQHKDFTHVPDAEGYRIATRFTVVNTEHDGSLTYKSNCNFFEVDGGRFNRVAVYMAGPNTLYENR